MNSEIWTLLEEEYFMKFWLYVVFVFGLLIACAAPQDRHFNSEDIPIPKEKLGRIRSSGTITIHSINDQPADYYSFLVKPGEYTAIVSYRAGNISGGKLPIRFTVNAGETVFICGGVLSNERKWNPSAQTEMKNIQPSYCQ